MPEIADIAHELRSPLGGISAMVELLAATRLDAAQERLVRALRQAALHLRTVASDLIDDPRGEFLPTIESASVRDCLDDFTVSCSARAEAQGIDFRLALAEHCGPMRVADRRHLRQILENLVDNALRLMTKGALVLSVQPVIEPSGTTFVRFELLDEGPGLSPAEAERIFGRRVTLADRLAGSGLGLAIVSDLVRRNGGHCGAQGRVDSQGACLWFTLPAVDKVETRSQPGLVGQRGSKVLVVDDHASSRQVLATLLQHLGLDVESTSSPIEALQLARCSPFSAIFTDMTMPEMDGWTLVRTIRHLPAPYRQCPIVGVTGRVSGDEQDRFLQCGGSAFVEKPITIAALKRALDHVGLTSRPSQLRQPA